MRLHCMAKILNVKNCTKYKHVKLYVQLMYVLAG